jgi:hypothetical protein
MAIAISTGFRVPFARTGSLRRQGAKETRNPAEPRTPYPITQHATRNGQQHPVCPRPPPPGRPRPPRHFAFRHAAAKTKTKTKASTRKPPALPRGGQWFPCPLSSFTAFCLLASWCVGAVLALKPFKNKEQRRRQHELASNGTAITTRALRAGVRGSGRAWGTAVLP